MQISQCDDYEVVTTDCKMCNIDCSNSFRLKLHIVIVMLIC